MKVEAWIKVYDEKGNLIVKKKAKSLVRQFLDLLGIMMAYTGRSVRRTDGSTVTVNPSSYVFACNSSAGDTSYGIVVGSGTNPVSVTDFALQTLIAHGSGAGQLSYGATSIGAVTVSGNKAFLYISRTLSNTSGGTVTVNEVGIYVRIGPGTVDVACIDRSLLSVPIPNGESRTFQYELSVVV